MQELVKVLSQELEELQRIQHRRVKVVVEKYC